MFARIETFFHRWHRRLSRSEWAIRHLGFTPSEGTAEQPGLLLIQIDGLARTQLERAVATGRMPFLKRLRERNGYELHSFYPGLPSTTPAVQAELYYGVRSAVPAFCFVRRQTGVLSTMFTPDCAKEREAACGAASTGLLSGGSSWSNIYTGGAGQWESHFCIASNGLGDLWRTKKIRNIFVFILLQLPAAARIAWLLLVETFAAIRSAARGIWRGENPMLELQMIASRVFIGTGLRELITIGAKVDVARGMPVVHVNYVGYDEHAHRRGPGSRFALRSLRAIDRAIKNLWREAQKSPRRDYSVWIFSDHGQEHARSFALEFPGGVERILRQHYDAVRQLETPAAARRTRRPHAEGPRAWQARGARATPEFYVSAPDEPFTLAALGPVGHVYFKEPLPEEKRRLLALRLVREGGVPGVLLRDGSGEMRWFHPQGEARVPDDVAPLLPHPEPLRAEIARDLATLLENPDSGDLVLLGWAPGREPWTFAPETGAHGGPGPEETRGFVLLPPRTLLPPGTEHFIRPAALRAAALHHLGRDRMSRWRASARAGTHLRLMTYNTHGCSGMDGRVSPRRIARVIREHSPDIVALQELDLGRRRSRAEDQAAIIARELDMQVVFCPTVTRGDEHYGHALLSRWPIEVVKRARLPHDPASWWQEPRAAIWARVVVAGQVINLVTTHLGLGVRERELQIRALLGPEWLDGVWHEEPVLVCGDFNALPGSVPHRIAAAQLRDVQAGAAGHRPLATFSSLQPLVRIDHIFASRHFSPQQIAVVRNDASRVASDHLPLMADLRIATAAADTSTTRPTSAAAHNPPAAPAALG
jgi:endonuclease/exonuclease/phosphatase family metal-dependent hydrolase